MTDKKKKVSKLKGTKLEERVAPGMLGGGLGADPGMVDGVDDGLADGQEAEEAQAQTDIESSSNCRRMQKNLRLCIGVTYFSSCNRRLHIVKKRL